MPYNTTPIETPKEYTGQANLPLARVKKIISADPEISHCSNNAAFAITIATESFIRYLSAQTHTIVRSERRQSRRNLQYRDVASAVHKYDNLEFLLDVVPRTITYKAWKDKQERLEKREKKKAEKGANEEKEDGDVRGLMAQQIRPVSLDGFVEEEVGRVLDGDEGGEDGEQRTDDETESEEVDGSEVRNGNDGMKNGDTRMDDDLPMEED